MQIKPSGASPRVVAYDAAVSSAGMVVLVWLVATADWSPVAADGYVFALLAAFLLIAEVMPIRVPGRVTENVITVSAAFALALLLLFGIGPAVAAYAGAAILAGPIYREPLLRIAFNAAQYTLSLAAAAAVVAVIGDAPYTGETIAGDLEVALLAGAAYVLVETALVGTVPAALVGVPLRESLHRDLAFLGSTSALLVACPPIIVAVADADERLAPLVVAPLLAVYLAGRQSMINHYRASHDALTGLPNRSSLQERIELELRAAEAEGSSLAVILLDLDDFKEINDTLGHQRGDLLLRQIGPRALEVLRDGDRFARFGGDEFAVVLPRLTGVEDAVRIAEEIISAVERPFPVEGVPCDVRTSAGIACFPQHGDEAETLLQRADIALYRAKARKTGHEVYDPHFDDYTRERLALAAELRHAIEREELVLHYQPKVTLDGDQLEGVEALVRWRHPQLGLISPDGFIPLAEQTGLIRPLTVAVLDVAVRQCRTWRDAGIELRLAVNLSRRDLLDRDLPETVRATLARWDVPPEALWLEITETAIMADLARAQSVLAELRASGVGLSIDDFGTGYSSLATLKDLPVGEIKIDRSFVSGMTTSDEDAAIVQSAIELAHNLGMKTTAEGVEDSDMHQRLAEWRCDYAQGFYLGRPAPAEELMKGMRRPVRIGANSDGLSAAVWTLNPPRRWHPAKESVGA